MIHETLFQVSVRCSQFAFDEMLLNDAINPNEMSKLLHFQKHQRRRQLEEIEVIKQI